MTALTPEATGVIWRRLGQWLFEAVVIMLLSLLTGVGIVVGAAQLGVGIEAIPYVAAGGVVGSALGFHLLDDLVLARRTKGRTLGMLVFGLRIVTLEGDPPSRKQLAVRWLLWVVDGLFWGLVAVVVMLCSPYRQRIGDLLARTVVVRASVSVDEPVLPGPDGDLGAVAESELALGAGQVRLDRGQ